MSTRWEDDELAPIAWWQTLGVLLLVSGVGPIVLVQVAWWLATGERLGA